MWGQPPSAARRAKRGARTQDKKLFLRRRALLLVRRSQRSLTLRDGQQRGVELNERGIHGRMSSVAAIAVGGSRNHLRGFSIIQAKEGPLPRKTRLVLYMHLHRHHFGTLIISFLVDGTLAFRAAGF